MLFLTVWLIAFVSLAVAAGILTIAYRFLGSDFGTEGLVREGIIALVASAGQAFVLWAVISLVGFAHGLHFVLAAVVAGLVYMVTHFQEMDRLEVSILAVTQLALYALGLFVAGVLK